MAVFRNDDFVKALDKAVQAREGKAAPRAHLGASVIGGKCARAIWYGFRWAYQEQHQGRLLRLFQRGNEEEFRFVEFLRLMGGEVQEYSQRLCYYGGSEAAPHYKLLDWDEEVPEYYEDVSTSRADIAMATDAGHGPTQWRFYNHGGHFSGSTDGRVRGLEAYGLNGWGLLEFKTHSEKSFKDVSTKGVLTSKPTHYAQMQTYMHMMKLPWALYMAVNKNTDEIYTEVILYREEFALQIVDRALNIIQVQAAPKRLTEDASWFECKFCAYREICHKGAAPQKNCRSCVFAEPVEDGQWQCNKHKQIIPPDFLIKGCESWEGIK